MMESTVIVTIIGSITTIILAWLNFHKDKKMKHLKYDLKIIRTKEKETDIKISVLDSFLQLSVYSKINDAVNVLFDETKIERFMIFIAINGVTDFNIVSIIFERYKALNNKMNALARYSNIKIDSAYKQLLKDVEKESFIEISTAQLSECMLKDIYDFEDIKHSVISFLFRKSIDSNSDLICYCSAATKSTKKITSIEKINLKTCVEGTIAPALIETLD